MVISNRFLKSLAHSRYIWFQIIVLQENKPFFTCISNGCCVRCSLSSALAMGCNWIWRFFASFRSPILLISLAIWPSITLWLAWLSCWATMSIMKGRLARNVCMQSSWLFQRVSPGSCGFSDPFCSAKRDPATWWLWKNFFTSTIWLTTWRGVTY